SLSKTDLYTLIVAQLLEDGFDDAAAAVGDAVQITAAAAGAASPLPMPARVPRQRLATLVETGLQHEQAVSGAERVSIYSGATADDVTAGDASDKFRTVMSSIDVDVDTDAPPRTDYASVFMANHKSAVLCASFSADGLYLCTASSDCSIKLLDVGKM